MTKNDKVDALRHEILLIELHRDRSWCLFTDWEKHFWSAHKKAKELELVALETFDIVRDRAKLDIRPSES